MHGHEILQRATKWWNEANDEETTSIPFVTCKILIFYPQNPFKNIQNQFWGI